MQVCTRGMQYCAVLVSNTNPHAHLMAYVPGWCVRGMPQAALPAELTGQAAPAGSMPGKDTQYMPM
jgi:hypothetical protein